MVHQTPSSSAFKMPSPLQQLSPERVQNAGRIISTTTTTSQKSSTLASETSASDQDITSSPTRRAKATLFPDVFTSKYPPNPPSPSTMQGFSLPQSPSLPEIHAFRSHVRTNSDVQGLVKRFEHLDVRDRDAESAERRKRHEAELRRAQIAREEAESDVKRLREEVRRLKREGEEGRERERLVGRRLEVVQEELVTTKSNRETQAGVYEKEMKKARKEAFKTSSLLLKIQEELKSTRNSLRITQQSFDLEKQKVQRKEQERFEMEYQLIPLQEQVEKLKLRVAVVEEEREALKRSLQEEEVARIAAEGLIALPGGEAMDVELLSSPRKGASPVKRNVGLEASEEDKENLGGVTRKMSEVRRLAEELERERMRRDAAEEMVEFLQLECRFRCCSCSHAASTGHRLAVELDAELAAAIERIRAGMQHLLVPQASFDEGYGTQEDGSQATTAAVMSQVEDSQSAPAAIGAVDTPMLDEPSFPHPATNRSPEQQLRDEEEAWLENSPPKPQQQQYTPQPPAPAPATSDAGSRPSTPPPQLSPPRTAARSIRTITTTTTIPMHFTPVTKPRQPLLPYLHTDTTGDYSTCAIDDEDAENIPPRPSTASKLEGSIQNSTQSSIQTPVQGSFDGLAGGVVIDREAALKMIAYRRGRAKSIANGTATPRKQMVEGLGARRDISAPALGQQIGTASVGKSATIRGKK